MLNTFLTKLEINTVEVFAVFEGDENHKRSDTCVMEYITVPNYDGTSATKQSEQKNCRNNTLAISDLHNNLSGLVIGTIVSQSGAGGAHSDLLMRLLGGEKITTNETVELKDKEAGDNKKVDIPKTSEKSPQKKQIIKKKNK